MAYTASMMNLRATDGFEPAAYRAAPSEKPIGGIVLLHEIFGVNQHIREVAQQYAGDGYLTVAPALFDRAARDVELDYDEAGIDRGRKLRLAVGWNQALLDLQAAINAAREGGRVAVIGYCWGGSLAFLAAARLDGVSCAVGYYGGQTVPFAAEKVRVPVMLHFGEFDPRVPPADIETIRKGNPDIEIHIFSADHGFNCDHRKEWHAESAKRARELALGFVNQHLQG